MSIRMIGIDHNKASIKDREIFSFTKKASAELLGYFKNVEDIYGGVILSTCNRMELWISCSDEYEESMYELLCRIKKVDSQLYRDYFIERSEMEAVKHLFHLTCGMKSKIIGEDQILTQVKNALELSRDQYCTDNVIEVLFRMAITSAKKIKTEVPLSAAHSSVIQPILHKLKKMDYQVAGKNCLVIGNGEMGKLAASQLKAEGAEVTVTVRQYKSGIVEIPEGCKRINYGERLEHLNEFELIISATSSPNTTLQYQQLKEMQFEQPKLFIDLAVPRDIDAEIGTLNNVTLYDIDYFDVELQSEEMQTKLGQIEDILTSQIEEFVSWYECRTIIPIVENVSQQASEDVHARIQKTIKKLGMDPEDEEILEESLQAAIHKVVNKLMFGIRDTVSTQTFRECVEAMDKIY